MGNGNLLGRGGGSLKKAEPHGEAAQVPRCFYTVFRFFTQKVENYD